MLTYIICLFISLKETVCLSRIFINFAAASALSVILSSHLMRYINHEKKNKHIGNSTHGCAAS